MAYVKHEWKTGDVVSSTKLNEMEDGIFNSQEKITETAKLSADLLSEGTNNKLVSAAEKTNWNSKTTVSIPETSTSTNEAKFLKVGDAEYKLASGEGKVWKEAELTVTDILSLARGREIVRTLSPEYDPLNFKNDYFVCKVDQTTYSNARTIYYGEEMKKVYINVDGLSTIIPYFINTVTNQIKEVGFDHNYYKTIALYAANAHETGKECYRDFDGRDIIYLQDVSQQKWEYNYEDEKEAEKIKREELDNDVIGYAVVFSIRGKGNTENPDCAFLYCLQDSQAAYWYTDTETPKNSKLKWANIEAGKAYPVTFDTEHDTLRWLLDSVETRPGSTEMWAVEMEDGEEASPAKKTKNWYLQHGIEFTLESGTSTAPVYQICSSIIIDKANNIFAECFGVNIRQLSNIFSFNSPYGESTTVKMDYIGRPNCYVVDNYAYTKQKSETEYETVVERNGYHLWTCDVDGVTVQLVIPDNCDEEGVPHRDTYIMSIDASTALSTKSIYRHTITVKTPKAISVGQYELNLSLCAVNSEAGESSVEYLLHSDESHQYADWILPVSGTIGRVIGQSPKADVIHPDYSIKRITLNANYSAVEFEKLWDSLNKQATIDVYDPENPEVLIRKEHSYYLFAWETGEGETLATHKIRIYRDLLATGDTTYFFEIDGAVNYKVTTTGDARWWKKGSEPGDWDFMSGENVIFDNSEDIQGIKQFAFGEGYIFVGWDNELLYRLVSKKIIAKEGDSAFGTMNQIARVYQAVRMRASWQTIGEGEEAKDLRTLFIDYVDYAGEWNSVAAITDYNKYDYDVIDFRSEVLTVKTPRNSTKVELALAK